MEGPTLFDLQALHNLDAIDFRELGLAQPRTPPEFAAAAFRALKSYSQGPQPVDAILSGHLYLGSIVCARNHAFLASTGVTDVLVMTAMEDDGASDFAGSSIRFWKLDLPDCLGYPVIAELRAALHLVESIFPNDSFPSFKMADIGGCRKLHCQNNRALFVHCQQGISRSTTFVVAYLMYRLYAQLPADADPEDVPDPGDIICRILNKRQVAPNASFRAQLQLLAECLRAAINDTMFSDVVDVRRRRQLEFDCALRYLEAYLETGSRAIGETIAYIREQLLTRLAHHAKQTLSLGLTAWAMKKSAARSSSLWLRDGVILENFLVYVQQPPSYISVITMHCPKKENAAFIESNARVAERWKGSETASFFRLPAFVEAGKSPPAKPSHVVEVSAAKGGHLTDLNLPDLDRSIPQSLFFQIRDEEVRRGRIREALGLHKVSEKTSPSTVPEFPNFSPEKTIARPLPPWDAQELFVSTSEAAAETGRLLNQLLQRFECKNWAMWAVNRVVMQCNKISDAFARYAKSNATHFATPSPEDSAPACASRKGLRRGEEDGEYGSERKRRRRLRYEDVDVPFLRREIDRTERLLKSLRRQAPS